jgi:alkanesulfonate monooxygenase SsuD/methylene tetrahydromethanopterin reductase-like flavin-dependent oxidoreductase (luciferase family)
MKLDTSIGFGADLAEVPALARAAEAIGFDALWSSETQHDPFLPLALVAEHTQHIRFGTAVAIAFARSPVVLAHTAWDLAGRSGGRFILGLGTQVKPHVERRFGMAWSGKPVAQLREFVQAIRAVWNNWQTGERVNFRGEHYKITLMTPFFSPAPIQHPHIPIYVAGVGAPLSRMAGEVADGFVVHPLNTAKYLAEVVRRATWSCPARPSSRWTLPSARRPAPKCRFTPPRRRTGRCSICTAGGASASSCRRWPRAASGTRCRPLSATTCSTRSASRRPGTTLPIA